MAYTHNVAERGQHDTLMMTPDKGGAEFSDEGSGATSGYGDLTEDDLINDDDDLGDDVLEKDPDADLMGDDADEDDDL